ncbi:MAG: 50S ribosomal protein L3 [archaeon]
MGKAHHPRRGSMGYAPRKRAKRIYPRVSTVPKTNEVKPLGFAGYKAGMAQIMMIDDRKESPTRNQEIIVPVTVLETPPLKVAGIRAYTDTPYGEKVLKEVWAEKLDKELERKTDLPKKKHKTDTLEKLEDVSKYTLIVHTTPKIAGIHKKKPELFEIDIGGKPEDALKYAKEKLGQELTIKEVFKNGELSDTIAITKGLGFQGSVKRFGVKLLAKKSQKVIRKAGNLGPWHPHKTRGTVPQMGQMGFHKRTQYNLRILKISEDALDINKNGWKEYGLVKSSYILVKGSIQGSTKRLVRLRPAIRPKNNALGEPEITAMIL